MTKVIAIIYLSATFAPVVTYFLEKKYTKQLKNIVC